MLKWLLVDQTGGLKLLTGFKKEITFGALHSHSPCGRKSKLATKGIITTFGYPAVAVLRSG